MGPPGGGAATRRHARPLKTPTQLRTRTPPPAGARLQAFTAAASISPVPLSTILNNRGIMQQLVYYHIVKEVGRLATCGLNRLGAWGPSFRHHVPQAARPPPHPPPREIAGTASRVASAHPSLHTTPSSPTPQVVSAPLPKRQLPTFVANRALTGDGMTVKAVGNSAQIVQGNIKCGQGLAHVINQVLLFVNVGSLLG